MFEISSRILEKVVEMQNVVQNVKVEIPPRFVVIYSDPRTIEGRLRDDQGTMEGRLREHLRLAEVSRGA